MPADERDWPYWTRNKLEILGGYLPAFSRAATKSSERLYIDLMAGQPVNRDAKTGEELDGSPRLALSADPRFTKLAFCELPGKAEALERDLRQRYPGRSFEVYPGDCNKTIDRVLYDLREYRWAPTFVFADQHAAEIHWETLRKVAAFKRVKEGATKAEIWLLVSPAETIRGVTGSNHEAFADRVDVFYGNDDWRRIQRARRQEIISADDYRHEMVNLIRWQLERALGYKMTARIPMRMPSGMPFYEMVFATDHWAGNKIMSHLYRKATARSNEMRQEALARAKNKRDEKSGRMALFDLEPTSIEIDTLTWEPENSWDPRERPWW